MFLNGGWPAAVAPQGGEQESGEALGDSPFLPFS